MCEIGWLQGIKGFLNVSAYDESKVLCTFGHICTEHTYHIVARCSLFNDDLLRIIDVIKNHKLLSGAIMRHTSVAVCKLIFRSLNPQIKVVDETDGGKRRRWWVSPDQSCS
jgi:hypothetical protein